MKKRNHLSPNAPCHCGSGRKYKKCHLAPDRASGVRNLKPAARTEADLIAALTSVEEQLRDPRELDALLVKTGKPVLLMDEHRMPPPDHFVFFSVVSLPGHIAIDVLHSITAKRKQCGSAALLSAPRLCASTTPDGMALREELESHLSKAQILRAGIRLDLLSQWRRESGFELKITPSRKRIRAPEHAVIQNIGVKCARAMGLTGLVLAVVDRSMQNGLDPSQHRLRDDELSAVVLEVPEDNCVLAMLGSTPEDEMYGDWLRLPDYDAARARKDPEFSEFSERVRANSVGELQYWGVSFGR